jgi:hypothetical protein
MAKHHDLLGEITYEQLEAFLQSLSFRQPLTPEVKAGLESLPKGDPIRVVAVLESETASPPWTLSHFRIG